MPDLISHWVMKSVDPPKAGWYMTWSEKHPEIMPLMWDGYTWYFPLGNDKLPMEMDMWCWQPIPPDVNDYHQLRAILASKNN